MGVEASEVMEVGEEGRRLSRLSPTLGRIGEDAVAPALADGGLGRVVEVLGGAARLGGGVL